MEGLKKQAYNEFEPDYKRGLARWSDDFDLYDADARTAITDFCDAARAAACSERECDLGLLHLPGSVKCFYEEFEAWKAAGYRDRRGTSNGGYSGEEICGDAAAREGRGCSGGTARGDAPREGCG